MNLFFRCLTAICLFCVVHTTVRAAEDPNGGEIKLYDMLHPKSGIGEQFEAAADQPRVVGVPPADAGRDLMRVSETEIRHYSGKGAKQFLCSIDNGETWSLADLPASFPPATSPAHVKAAYARYLNHRDTNSTTCRLIPSSGTTSPTIRRTPRPANA